MAGYVVRVFIRRLKNSAATCAAFDMLLYYNKSFFWLLVERRGSVFYRFSFQVGLFLNTVIVLDS